MKQVDKNNTAFSECNNKLQIDEIEIKAYLGNNHKIAFYITAKKVTIDWGDGSIDEITLNSIERNNSINPYTTHGVQKCAHLNLTLPKLTNYLNLKC